jgi:hypothetical protein
MHILLRRARHGRGLAVSYRPKTKVVRAQAGFASLEVPVTNLAVVERRDQHHLPVVLPAPFDGCALNVCTLFVGRRVIWHMSFLPKYG